MLMLYCCNKANKTMCFFLSLLRPCSLAKEKTASDVCLHAFKNEQVLKKDTTENQLLGNQFRAVHFRADNV